MGCVGLGQAAEWIDSWSSHPYRGLARSWLGNRYTSERLVGGACQKLANGLCLLRAKTQGINQFICGYLAGGNGRMDAKLGLPSYRVLVLGLIVSTGPARRTTLIKEANCFGLSCVGSLQFNDMADTITSQYFRYYLLY